MKIIIPMAGKGKRFADAGYSLPKPLIEIKGRIMLAWALDSFKEFPRDTEFIFIALKEECLKFKLREHIKKLMDGRPIRIMEREGVSKGAAITVYDALAHFDLLDSEEELIIANCDQKVVFDKNLFFSMKDKSHIILTFEDDDPRWSFALVKNGLVCEVAEKKPISNLATAGIYYFMKIKDFAWATDKMIESEKTVNNEYYVCPAYNELIMRGDKVKVLPVKKMIGLGTPEEVLKFIKE